MVKVTGSSNKRVSVAALIAVKPGRRPRLIYRTHPGRRHRAGQRKGFTETGYARLLDAAHQQLGGPLVVVWDNLNAHVSGAMAELIAARSWLSVYQLPSYAHELNPVEPVWSHLKRSLANLAKRNLSQLTTTSANKGSDGHQGAGRFIVTKLSQLGAGLPLRSWRGACDCQ